MTPISFLRAFALCCLAALVATSVSAKGFLYDCTMEDTGALLGWVSPKIAIVIPEEGAPVVIDALTLTFAQDPVPITILRDDGVRFIARWSLENVRADSGRSFANFDYRASISQATGRIELTVGPRSTDSGLRGAGSCQKRTR
ncbi:MAG: hypothetical protein AAF307_02745 [Pseudomonadota bacterium]